MKLLTINNIIEITGLSKTTIKRLELQGEFPPRVHITKRGVRWLEADLESWLLGKRENISRKIKSSKRKAILYDSVNPTQAKGGAHA